MELGFDLNPTVAHRESFESFPKIQAIAGKLAADLIKTMV